nr:hypothetical protein [Nostoc sp. CreGUA01]
MKDLQLYQPKFTLGNAVSLGIELGIFIMAFYFYKEGCRVWGVGCRKEKTLVLSQKLSLKKELYRDA